MKLDLCNKTNIALLKKYVKEYKCLEEIFQHLCLFLINKEERQCGRFCSCWRAVSGAERAHSHHCLCRVISAQPTVVQKQGQNVHSFVISMGAVGQWLASS